MNTAADVQKLLERIHRAHERANSPKGQRADILLFVKFESGATQELLLFDTKKPAECQDDIASLIHWIASLKDHMRAWLRTNGRDPDEVQRSIAKSSDLCLCIDLDNREKHGGRIRKGPRHGGMTDKKPRFGTVIVRHVLERGEGILVIQPGATVHSKVDPTKWEIKHGRLDRVLIIAPVLGEDGQEIGDALEIAKRAMDHWESFLQEIEGLL